LNHSIRSREKLGRERKALLLSGREVDDQLELGGHHPDQLTISWVRNTIE
jgi:hypothetical protein